MGILVLLVGRIIDDDWQNLTTKANIQASSIQTIGFASYTVTQVTTPTAVPTSVDTSDNGLDFKDGVNVTPSEPRLFTSKVIDLEDDVNGINHCGGLVCSYRHDNPFILS